MAKKLNIYVVIVLCLAALVVLNQEKQKGPLPTGRVADVTAPDRLVVVQAYDVLTLDPARADDTGSLRVITNIYEGLVRYKPGTTEVEPCLATSWETSRDGLQWTFNLRRDVTFHDGTPLDAGAVAASVKRQMGKKQKGVTTYADFVYAPVEKVEVVDSHTVRFMLRYPYAPFLSNLAVPMAAPVVGPQAEGQVLPPGTGPFVPAGEKDGGLLLRANHDYWGAAPKVEEVLYLTVADSQRRAKMIIDGHCDIALDLNFDHAAALRFEGYPVYRTTGLDICYLGFYNDRKPFDSPDVRRAVALSLNREEIFKHLGLQHVQPALGYLPPGMAGGDKVVQPGYDPSEARQLLKKAGYQQGLTFTIITYTDSRPYTPGGGEELARALARSAAGSGININVRAYPWAQFKQALLKREGDAFLYGWTSDNGDPDNILYTLLAPDQIEHGQNITRYNSAELETLLVSGRITSDPSTRRDLYARAQDVLNQDTPWVVLGHSLHHAATAPGVKGFVLHPTGWHWLGSASK